MKYVLATFALMAVIAMLFFGLLYVQNIQPDVTGQFSIAAGLETLGLMVVVIFAAIFAAYSIFKRNVLEQ